MTLNDVENEINEISVSDFTVGGIVSSKTYMGGLLGTNPFAVSQHFSSRGFDVKWQTDLSKVSKNAEAYIILFAWYNGSAMGAHYQAAYYDQYGDLITTNGPGRGSYNDFMDFYNNNSNIFGMVVMEIDGGCP